MNPPSQAEKLKHSINGAYQNLLFNMDYNTISNGKNAEQIFESEIMTAIADYISGIELPERYEVPSLESHRIPSF